MSPRPRARGRRIPAMVACFYAGIAAGWILHAALTPKPGADAAGSAVVATPSTAARRAEAKATDAPPPPKPSLPAVATSGKSGGESPAAYGDPVRELQHRDLRLPIDGADVERMKGGFAERRDGGGRGHEAVDILAPRNTPIHAVEDGTIAKLFHSKAGGTTIYQFDPSRRFCYYYAHLERYAVGLREGQDVSRGDVIGYVGTSGNAPPDTPHLHFAIFALNDDHRWWQGAPLDPYEAFAH